MRGSAPQSHRPTTRPPAAQRGTVLVVALVFLVIMTLLGVGAMQSSVLEERMAGNLRDDRVSFEAAESALRAGEQALRDNGATLDFNGTGGLYHHADENAPDPLYFTAGESIELSPGLDSDLIASQPRYFMEKLPPVTPPGNSIEAGTPVTGKSLYRIVARGKGGSEDSETVLQSTFLR